MIPIKINNTKVNIFAFDDSNTVIERYVVANGKHVKDNIITVPQFLRFDKDRIKFEKNKTYTVFDIRDELPDTIENLMCCDVLNKLLIRYPQFDNQHLIYLFLLTKDFANKTQENFVDFYDENDLHNLFFQFHSRTLFSAEKLYKAILSYRHSIESTFKNLENNLEANTSRYIFFSEYVGPVVEPFNVSDVNISVMLYLPNGESLYDIFDAFDISEQLPFLVMIDKSRGTTKKLYKIYQEFSPPDSWVIGNDEESGIYFYISDIQDVKRLWPTPDFSNKIDGSTNDRAEISDEVKILSKLYNKGSWNTSNIVKFHLNFENEESKSPISKNSFSNFFLKDKLLSLLQTRVTYEILDTVQSNIRGTCIFSDTTINKAVFCDLIMNDENVKYFLFVDESKNSSLLKPRFTFYFEPNQHGLPVFGYGKSGSGLPRPLTVTITFLNDKKSYIHEPTVRSQKSYTHEPTVRSQKSYMMVRVSKAKSVAAAENFIQLFKNIFGYYQSRHDEIIKIYKSLYSKVNFSEYNVKATISKKDTKTGDRLKALKKHNIEAFGEGQYSTKCQTGKQPYVVDKSNINEIKKKFKNISNEEKRDAMLNHGLINWPLKSDDYYACYPRDSKKDKKEFEWPGLVCLDKVNFRPCCFKEDQYVKRGSGLDEYLKSGNFKCSEKESAVTSKAISRPLNADKHVEPGKLGELPYYMQVLATHSGYVSTDIKNRISLPILRYGVMDGPSSFIHCVYAALNPYYFNMTTLEKNNIIKQELEEISKSEYLYMGRQETFDYPIEKVSELLTLNDSYIDPDIFVTIFEKYFEPCNIIVFKRDFEYPHGDLNTPRYSLARLNYKPDLRKPSYSETTGGENKDEKETREENENTIVIVKFQMDNGEHQCELVVKYEGMKLQYVFNPNDPFIISCFKVVDDVNNVYITSYERLYKKIKPQITIHEIK